MNGKLTLASQGALPVDAAEIEKSLAELWRAESEASEEAVVRAALWNVVAHTANERDQLLAGEILAKASAAVPQRTIIIRAEPSAAPGISSWISANCHLVGKAKQVCSEQVSIAAGGGRVNDIAPLVNALLIADMPVAVWWVGDLPDDSSQYVDELLDPADRLIVDSSQFSGVADLELVAAIGRRTHTAPADLSWVRIEHWRSATASLFDAPLMREKLQSIARVTITAARAEGPAFGQSAEALYYAAWLSAQTGTTPDFGFETVDGDASAGSLSEVHIEFVDASDAVLTRSGSGVVVTSCETLAPASTAHPLGCAVDELIVRQLKNPAADSVFMKALPVALSLASRITT